MWDDFLLINFTFVYRPLLGFKDSDLSVTTKEVVTPDRSQLNMHYLQSCIKGKPGQKSRICFQTSTDGTKQGYVLHL